VAWFIVGDFNGATGDLEALLRGRSGAGRLHGGLLPGDDVRLPAACLAMYRTGRADAAARWRACCVDGAHSFLTGVTEPIEFTSCSSRPGSTRCTRCSRAPRW
jgi:PTS system N-acetylglucosamine-specific IIC component